MSDSAQSNKLCLALKWVKLNTETMQPNTRHENKKKHSILVRQVLTYL